MSAYNYRYWMVLTGLILPGLLINAIPGHAALIRVLAAAIISPIVGLMCIFAIRPLIDHVLGVKLMPFDTRREKMVFYAILRTLILVAGIYIFIAFVIPTWFGAFDVYVLGEEPNVISAVVDRQGSGLSFAPLASTLQVQGQSNDFIWFYGYYLQLNEHYTITTLPKSNIVMDVTND